MYYSVITLTFENNIIAIIIKGAQLLCTYTVPTYYAQKQACLWMCVLSHIADPLPPFILGGGVVCWAPPFCSGTYPMRSGRYESKPQVDISGHLYFCALLYANKRLCNELLSTVPLGMLAKNKMVVNTPDPLEPCGNGLVARFYLYFGPVTHKY